MGCGTQGTEPGQEPCSLGSLPFLAPSSWTPAEILAEMLENVSKDSLTQLWVKVPYIRARGKQMEITALGVRGTGLEAMAVHRGETWARGTWRGGVTQGCLQPTGTPPCRSVIMTWYGTGRFTLESLQSSKTDYNGFSACRHFRKLIQINF